MDPVEVKKTMRGTHKVGAFNALWGWSHRWQAFSRAKRYPLRVKPGLRQLQGRDLLFDTLRVGS